MLDFLLYYATPFMATLAAIFVATIILDVRSNKLDVRSNKHLSTNSVLGRDKK